MRQVCGPLRLQPLVAVGHLSVGHIAMMLYLEHSLWVSTLPYYHRIHPSAYNPPLLTAHHTGSSLVVSCRQRATAAMNAGPSGFGECC